MTKIQFKVFLILGMLFISQACNHDQIAKNFKPLIVNQNVDEKARLLAASNQSWRNLRILIDQDNLNTQNKMNSTKLAYVQKLVTKTVEYLQATFKVYSTSTMKLTQSACQDATVQSKFLNTDLQYDLFIIIQDGIKDAGLLGTALACQQDANQQNRPIVGEFMFNPDTIKMVWEDDYSTFLHEVAHVMAFSSYLFDYFVDENQNPRQKSNVVQTVNYRGNSQTMMITPRVKKVAQDYFNCPSLQGMYLESQGGAGSAGSHWEKSLILNEIMVANSIKSPVWTVFTHALFEDSGWYQANANMVQPITFGKGKGCSFVNGACVVNQQVQFPTEFCSKDEIDTNVKGCFYDYTTKGYCGASDTKKQLTNSFYNYYNDFTNSDDTFTDNCIYKEGSTSRACTISGQTSSSYYEETFGLQSRCFTGDFINSKYVPTKHNSCLKSECKLDSSGNQFVRVFVGSQQFDCPSQGGSVSVVGKLTGYSGNIDCPAASTFCPLFYNTCNDYVTRYYYFDQTSSPCVVEGTTGSTSSGSSSSSSGSTTTTGGSTTTTGGSTSTTGGSTTTTGGSTTTTDGSSSTTTSKPNGAFLLQSLNVLICLLFIFLFKY